MRKGKTGDATKARRLKSASLYKLSNCRQINTPLSLSLSLSLHTTVSTHQLNPCKYYSSVHPWQQELQLLKLAITKVNDIYAKSLISHGGGPSSPPPMWNLWYTKWHYDSFRIALPIIPPMFRIQLSIIWE